MGTLYVVSTPIGNLGDVTLRALEVLRTVPLIAAEDTRHTRKLLTHHGISTRLVSYHAHNRRTRLDELLSRLGEGDIALVTDAGTPVVSDPGQELVRAAAQAGHNVVVVPGPSALTAALAVSGIDAPVMHFAGFLPRRQSERKRLLRDLAEWPGALVVFEAPHRLVAALEDVHAMLGDVQVAVCCELTKRFESVVRGAVSDALAHYRQHEPRGEFTLVLQLPELVPAHAEGREPVDIPTRFAALSSELRSRNRALAALAQETGLPRKDLYARLVVERD